MEFGKSIQILLTTGEGLCLDDVTKRSKADCYSSNLDEYRSSLELFEWHGTTTSISKFYEDVERTCVGGPRRTAESNECPSIEFEHERTSIGIGHSRDSQSRVQHLHRRRESLHVLGIQRRDTIDVAGSARCAVEAGCQTPNENKFDATPNQCSKNSVGVKISAGC